MKTLGIIAILAPWPKSDFYVKIMLFMVKSKNIQNSMKLIKYESFINLAKKIIFMPLMQGLIFHGNGGIPQFP